MMGPFGGKRDDGNLWGTRYYGNPLGGHGTMEPKGGRQDNGKPWWGHRTMGTLWAGRGEHGTMGPFGGKPDDGNPLGVEHGMMGTLWGGHRMKMKQGVRGAQATSEQPVLRPHAYLSFPRAGSRRTSARELVRVRGDARPSSRLGETWLPGLNDGRSQSSAGGARAPQEQGPGECAGSRGSMRPRQRRDRGGRRRGCRSSRPVPGRPAPSAPQPRPLGCQGGGDRAGLALHTRPRRPRGPTWNSSP